MRSHARRFAVLIAVLVAVMCTAVAPATAAAVPAQTGKAIRHVVHPRVGAPPEVATERQHPISDLPPRSLVSMAQAGAHALDPIDLKLLVIAADGKETDFPAIKAFLDQLGVPYDTLLATTTPLTAGMLWDGGLHGYYQGIILTTGNLTYFNGTGWQSALSNDQWQTLWQYEALFKVRQVTSYTYPTDTYGLTPVTYQDTTNNPLQATLTSAGQGVYSYLNPSNPLTFKNAWVYLATIADPTNTTPLLQTASGYTLASIHNYPDGRQNLAITAANNPYLIHSMLLSYGSINWVTKGLFLGQRHVQLDATIDDLFIEDNLWNTTTLSDLNDNYNYRMTGDDLLTLVRWQSRIQTSPNFSSLKTEWAYNGQGTEAGYFLPDTLTPAVVNNGDSFNFVNHTYSHFNLDNPLTPVDQFIEELSKNNQIARQLKFRNYWKDTMVQPDISGLNNPTFQQAAATFGIRYMISDTSQPGWNNPSPNAGFYSTYQPSILIIPRHPTNLFYNLSTPNEWVSEYNCYYGPGTSGTLPGSGTCAGGKYRYWDHDLSYQEILDVESGFMLSYLLKWDIDPIMFHQTNVKAYDGTHSLYSDLMDALLAKYSTVYKLPIINHSEHQLGIDMAQRMAYNASGVTASLVPCQSLTVTTKNPAEIPVTGLSGAARTEVYGGQQIGYLRLDAGQSVTVPVSC